MVNGEFDFSILHRATEEEQTGALQPGVVANAIRGLGDEFATLYVIQEPDRFAAVMAGGRRSLLEQSIGDITAEHSRHDGVLDEAGVVVMNVGDLPEPFKTDWIGYTQDVGYSNQ